MSGTEDRAFFQTAPDVASFFDEATNTVTYVVSDREARVAAIIDSVLDFDPSSGRVSTASADRLVAFVEDQGLRVGWIIETHVHADHLTAAPYLKRKLGGRIAVGAAVGAVQRTFARVFNMEGLVSGDGSEFDHLFADGETYRIGTIPARALHTPGHTPACMTHVIGDAAFVGDTIFMPDFGSARCDFPGGDAGELYRSARRIFDLPDATRVFVNHDYKAPGRDAYRWESTVADQRQSNIHLRDGIGEADFVAMRKARDATLAPPRLLLPSVQVNIRAGRLPPPEANGVRYLRLPMTFDDAPGNGDPDRT